MLESRKGMIYSSRHGWIPKPEKVTLVKRGNVHDVSHLKDTSGDRYVQTRRFGAVLVTDDTKKDVSIPRSQIELTISGLGAYRTDKNGKTYPSSKAVNFTDTDRVDAGGQSVVTSL